MGSCALHSFQSNKNPYFFPANDTWSVLSVILWANVRICIFTYSYMHVLLSSLSQTQSMTKWEI